ncbi:MAG: HAD hydrolase family protein [Mycoplasmoidaceae bacterium]
MGQIKWVLMNIDSIWRDIQNNKIENGEIRRTLNYLIDNGVNFTSISGYHSKIASKMASNLYMPVNDSYLICSYGGEIYSFKKKRVVERFLLDNKAIKQADTLVRKIDFNFCQKIFVEIYQKNGDVYIWDNKYKMFNKKLEEYQRLNKNVEFEVIDDINAYTNLLNISITFLENVDLNSVVKLFNNSDNSLSFKIMNNRKIIITAPSVSPSTAMDIINNNKKYRLEKSAIMSFSDSLNDIGIFKKSFVAITVDSAHEELKKSATNVFVGVESLYINEYLKKEIIKSS